MRRIGPVALSTAAITALIGNSAGTLYFLSFGRSLVARVSEIGCQNAKISGSHDAARASGSEL